MGRGDGRFRDSFGEPDHFVDGGRGGRKPVRSKSATVLRRASGPSPATRRLDLTEGDGSDVAEARLASRVQHREGNARERGAGGGDLPAPRASGERRV